MTEEKEEKQENQFLIDSDRLSEKALAVLTDEQREKLKKMKGAEFKFPQQRGGRGLPF